MAVLAASLLAVAVAWALVAYVVMPASWKRYERTRHNLDGLPGITETSSAIPGDPLNLALAGTEVQVRAAFAAAGWTKPDPLSLDSDARIAADSVLGRPYAGAPVSNLYLFGRKQDLAFEIETGPSTRSRHHVRLWLTPRVHPSGAPLWLGAASFDTSVGISRTTGQFTHHIAPNVDQERDHVIESLQRTGRISEVVPVLDFHPVREGRNGGGDPWHTDGTLLLGIISD